MAIWDITAPAGSAQGAAHDVATGITPPGDFDGATIDSVAVINSPTMSSDGESNDTAIFRWWIQTSTGTAIYGSNSADGAICDAVWGLSTSESPRTILNDFNTAPKPTVAVAADWDEIRSACSYTAEMKNDNETFTWSAFTIRVTYTPINLQQEHYRFATPIDGAAHEAWTLVGTEDTSFEIATAQLDVGHALITKIGNDGAASQSTGDFTLEYNKDGGGWNAVGDVSSNVRYAGSGDTDDATSATERLTNTARGFKGSVLQEGIGGAAVADYSIGNNEDAELYWAIIFRSADLSGGESIQFRVVHSVSTITYDITPTATIQSAGGTINEVTKTDTIAVADSEREEHELRRQDTLTVTDADISFKLAARAIADNIAVIDSDDWFKNAVRTQSDAIAIVDINEMLRKRFRELTETVNLSYSAETIRKRSVEILNNVTELTDAIVAAKFAAPVVVTDTIVVTDAVIMLRRRLRTLLDLIDVIDALVILRERNRLLADSIAVVDADVWYKQSPRTILDLIDVTDASIPLRERNRQLLELIEINDAAIMLRQRFRTFLDTITVTDTAIATKTRAPVVRTLLDTLEIVDFVRKLHELRRRDEIDATDAIRMSHELRRRDDMSVTDAVTAISIRARALLDTLDVTDESIKRHELRRRDVIAVVDNIVVITSGVISKTLTDAFNVTDAIRMTHELRRRDTADATDAAHASARRPKALSDALSTSDLLNFFRARGRVLTDNPTITDAAIATIFREGIIVNLRTLMDQLSVSDLTDAEKIFYVSDFIIKHGIEQLAVDHRIENFHILNKIRRET